MSYTQLIRRGSSTTEIKEYLAGGDMSPITIRIPRNLRDAAKESANLQGMSFSALVRKCLIAELTDEER